MKIQQEIEYDLKDFKERNIMIEGRLFNIYLIILRNNNTLTSRFTVSSFIYYGMVNSEYRKLFKKWRKSNFKDNNKMPILNLIIEKEGYVESNMYFTTIGNKLKSSTDKKCNVCGIIKPLKEFNKFSNTRHNFCRTCMFVKRNSYNERIRRMYLDQLRSSRLRGHKKPSYSRLELLKWLKQDKRYDKLYRTWVKSNYNKNLVPSCDRLDTTKGYSFENIDMVTWKVNLDRAYEERRLPKNKLSKKIKKYNSNHRLVKTYLNISRCSKDVGITTDILLEYIKNGKQLNHCYFSY